MSDEWWKVIIGAVVVVVGLLLGGGTMGKIVGSTLKTMVDAFIKAYSGQNERLIKAVEGNTEATRGLTNAINLDIAQQKLFNTERRDQMARIETKTDEMKGKVTALNEELQRRIR